MNTLSELGISIPLYQKYIDPSGRNSIRIELYPGNGRKNLSNVSNKIF